MKIVHAADLHLDSPMRGLSRYAHAPADALRLSTRSALSNLVDFCLAEGAALLLISGDLYDGELRDYDTALYLSGQMSRLREGNVQVVWIRGNHDAQSQITRHLQMPDNVHELSTEAPESYRLEHLQVAVHGQGFAQPAVKEDLAARYPDPEAGALNIGLLHTALSGREGHLPYAPTDAKVLASRGYAYWALGHVHTTERVSEAPWIVFPGNLQGRHARETGAKGAMLLETEGSAITRVQHVPLDVVRWAVCEVDVGEASGAFDVQQLCREALEREVEAAEGRLLAARLRLVGATAAHAELHADDAQLIHGLRALAIDVPGGDVWLEKVKLETRPKVDAAELRERDDALGQLARTLHGLLDDPQGLAELLDDARDLQQRLPPELAGRPEADLASDDKLREVLRDVEALLLPRLLEHES